MEVLKPPTDTLYKFVAISGLLIFITSLVSPVWLNQKLHNEYAEHLRGQDILLLDAKVWEQAMKEVDTAAEVFSVARNRLPQTQEEFDKSEIPPAELKRLMNEANQAGVIQAAKIKEFRQKLLEWRKQDAQVRFKHDLLETTKISTDRMLLLSSFGVTAGLLMSIMGFMLWYKRTQKPEDLILKKKSEDTASP